MLVLGDLLIFMLIFLAHIFFCLLLMKQFVTRCHVQIKLAVKNKNILKKREREKKRLLQSEQSRSV